MRGMGSKSVCAFSVFAPHPPRGCTAAWNSDPENVPPVCWAFRVQDNGHFPCKRQEQHPRITA